MANDNKITSNLFEIIGFHKSYWVGNKLVGNIKMDKPDRKEIGWAGKKKEILKEDVYLPDSRKTIKKGKEVVTELNVLYGKSKIKFFGLKQNRD
jgi:hypothetical protein